jgi:hypothetical protein
MDKWLCSFYPILKLFLAKSCTKLAIKSSANFSLVEKQDSGHSRNGVFFPQWIVIIIDSNAERKVETAFRSHFIKRSNKVSAVRAPRRVKQSENSFALPQLAFKADFITDFYHSESFRSGIATFLNVLFFRKKKQKLEIKLKF